MEKASPGVSAPGTHRENAPGHADFDDVERARSGDTRAFERLYRANLPRIFNLARRMLGDEHADEATQEIFVRAWEKLAGFRGEAAFGTWLYRLGVNEILDRRGRLGRSRDRYGGGDETMQELPARTARPDLALDFERAIVRLPEGARDVLVLHDVEGYRHEEIADMLGVTVGTTKAQLHRARMLMRRHLGT
jgi:RNA polymerase sigma-70 factor (ECF subfamily)